MAFTVEVFFTGLGVGLIREDKNNPGYVTGVDLLLVDTRMNMMDMNMIGPQHLPRLYFEVEDLAQTTASVDIPGVTTTGMPLVMLNLTDKDIRINVSGNGDGPFGLETAVLGATMPGPNAPEDAVNWIPDLDADLGISDLIQPGDTLAGSPYAARVKLPAGRVSSERLFVNEQFGLAEFKYGDAATTRVLADQFVWTREGVSSVEIAGLDAGYQLDALLKQARKEDTTVRIAVTCLPATLVNPDRFRRPDHFPMFQQVSTAGTVPSLVRAVGDGPVCSGAACPPPRSTVSVGGVN
jgi:hypothetical protein